MLSEERIMEIAECCPVWYAIPQGREKVLLTRFARCIEREVYKQERMRERVFQISDCEAIRNLEIEEQK